MRKAFSLIELSIVLIIIALLVAGVASGSKLIANGERQKLIKEFDLDKSNLTTFLTAYDGYPGDLVNASSYWVGATDGDGDRIVMDSGEELNYWNHLELAGIVTLNGLYNGFPTVGSSVLTGSMGSKGLRKRAYNTSNYSSFYTLNVHMVHYGSGVKTDDKFFVPKESYLIDTKIDDGLPKSGDMTIRIAGTTTDALCTNTSSAYYLASDAIGCNIVIYNGL